MNVLHLLSWFPTPDDPTLGNFCVRMIDALPEDCHSIILSVCDGKNMTKSFEVKEIPGAHHTHVQIYIRPPKINAIRKLKMLRMYQYGLKYIKQRFFKPDLIHLHVTYPLGQVALLWKKLFGYKYVLTEHWTIYQPQNKDVLVGKLKRKIVKIANNAELIMPVSLDLQRCMEGHGVHNRFQVIYNLVNTDIFKLRQPPCIDSSLRTGLRRNDMQGSKKRMLHISTLRDEAKNFSGILRVVERLRQQRDDFELHVIHDYYAPEFKAFVKEHHLEGCVIFHGKKTSAEVAEAYQQADFFVLFSNFENLPCVIVEAFASGVPVLSTSVGGIAEILSPERGILIPQGDEDALLQGMIQMLDHSSEYDHQAIRNYAIKTFAAQNIGQQIFEAYKKVVIS
ncbi:MAG: group 1 glycosyl transferase [bacterium F082]|nr:MAG: group 1 glycosyl transferase [bacterium F082]KWW31480.1 MAG: group 1 glycosyl transferase [bacterium P201]